MSTLSKATKEQLVKMIDELEKNPKDKIRIIGDTGIILVSAGLGATMAGSLASAVGATTAISLFGWTVVAATPIGWVIGYAIAVAAVVYRISRLIHGGGKSEGSKLQLLHKYREDIKNIEAKEKSGNIADSDDRTDFILSLRELIDKNMILPDKAFKLIEQVEQGRISISQASTLIQDLLNFNVLEVNV